MYIILFLVFIEINIMIQFLEHVFVLPVKFVICALWITYLRLSVKNLLNQFCLLDKFYIKTGKHLLKVCASFKPNLCISYQQI